MSETNLQNRRRSQRVLLQVAVLVRTEMPGGKRLQVQAFTLVVNAHGGLLESPLRMTADQQITLVNPQIGKEVDCRVVQVEGQSDASFTIAFEFDQRTPRFWPITFPLRIGGWRRRWQVIIAERLRMLDLQPACMYEEKISDEEIVHDL